MMAASSDNKDGQAVQLPADKKESVLDEIGAFISSLAALLPPLSADFISCSVAPLFRLLQQSGCKLYVKTLAGRTIVLGVGDMSLSMREVKRRVQELSCVPVEQQRLIFAGKQLEEDRT